MIVLTLKQLANYQCSCWLLWIYSWTQWASYQIRQIAGCACAGNAGNVFPRRRFQRKPLVSDPGMHHGTCVTHVPWCTPGSLTCGDGENVPGIPGACAPVILRIWQETHGVGKACQCFPLTTRYVFLAKRSLQLTHSSSVIKLNLICTKLKPIYTIENEIRICASVNDRLS